MEKDCVCGGKMEIQLRTLVYQSHVEIENVPVFVCETCEKNQVLEEVKPELKSLLKELGHHPEKKQVSFDEISAFTQLLVSHSCLHTEEQEPSIHPMNIDDWLDLYLLVQSLEDQTWAEEILAILKQIDLNK